MPKTSRSVARRLGGRKAGKKKGRERVPGRPATVQYSGLAADGVERQPTQSAVATSSSKGQRAPSAVARRPFSAYAADYAYVFADLRRIAIVAGGLLAGLIALSFVGR